MAETPSRYANLRTEFDRITDGMRTQRGYDVTDSRWREVVNWLFTKFIDVLMSGASRFWSRLDADEQATLRGFARDLGLRPRSVLTNQDHERRGEIIRILRKAFGLRPEGARDAAAEPVAAPRG